MISRETKTLASPVLVFKVARTFMSRSPLSLRQAAAMACSMIARTVSFGRPFSSAMTSTSADICFKSKLSILLLFSTGPAGPCPPPKLVNNFGGPPPGPSPVDVSVIY